MSLPVVVLAGGLATRLGSITEQIPKSLLDVGGEPFAVHQIELLRSHDLRDITFLVGHLGEDIASTLGDGSRWGVRLRYVFDGPQALGTGGAIRNALSQLASEFFVIYGDSYLECDYAAVAQAFLASGKRGLMTVFRNDDQFDRSNVQLENGRIVRYDKQHQTPDMRHIDYGLGALQQSAFASHRAGESFDLAALYQELLAINQLAAFEVRSRFYEIGSTAGLSETQAYLSTKRRPNHQ